MWQSVNRAFSTWFWGERISKGKIRVIILDQIGLFVVSFSKSQETRGWVCVCVFSRKGWVVIRFFFVLCRWKNLENRHRIVQNWVLAFRTQLWLIRVRDVIPLWAPPLHVNTRALMRNPPFGQIEQRIKAKALKSHLFRLGLRISPKTGNSCEETRPAEMRKTFPPSSRRRRCSSSLSWIPPPLPRDLFLRLNLKWRLFDILRRRSPPWKRKHAFLCVYNTEGVARLYLSPAVSEGAARWRQRCADALGDVMASERVHQSWGGDFCLFVCLIVCFPGEFQRHLGGIFFFN